MPSKKVVAVTACAAAVVAFVAVSIGRYQLVVEPQRAAEAEAAALAAAEERSSAAIEEEPQATQEGEQGIGDISRYPAQEQQMILYLTKHRWVSSKGDLVLSFTAESIERQTDGRAAETLAFAPGEYLSVRDDGALGAADGEVMAASVDDAPALLYLRLKEAPDADASSLPDVVLDGSGERRAYALTSTCFGDRIFFPVEEIELRVEVGEELRRVVGDGLPRVESALRGLCDELYPTATAAQWQRSANVDYDDGVYAFYFSLDDTTLADVTVLYRQSDSAVQARAGICSDFDEGDGATGFPEDGGGTGL